MRVRFVDGSKAELTRDELAELKKAMRATDAEQWLGRLACTGRAVLAIREKGDAGYVDEATRIKRAEKGRKAVPREQRVKL